MRVPRRQLALVLAAVPSLVLGAAVIYALGMTYLEGKPRGFLESLQWASETLTTTGYGADARWTHPLMALFVMTVQFAGVFLVVLVLPVILVPFLESRFEVRLPRKVAPLAGHVVIYGWGPAVTTLVRTASAAKVATVVVEPDEATARRLVERGQRLVHAALEDGGLEGAQLLTARALIANSTDEINAAVILTARQLGFTGEVYAVAEEPLHRRPLKLAGASAVFTPRHVLGAALAARASARISPRVAGIQQLGALAVREVRVQPGSPLIGALVEELGLAARRGVVVVGLWRGGELQAPVAPRTPITPGAVLVLVGPLGALAEWETSLRGTTTVPREGLFLVGGYGEVGRKVVELLRDAGETVRVVDRLPLPGVDVVGDMFDPALLESLELRQAQAIVLALDNDSATLFATVICREAARHVPIIARVNRAVNVERVHRAGADFALSISQVAGQILARRLLGEETVDIDARLKLSRVEAGAAGLVGQGWAELEALRPDGVAGVVVAVERDGELLGEAAEGLRLRPGDGVYLCGRA